VTTYTDILDLLDSGKLPMWRGLPAPRIAVNYWRLQEDANMRYYSYSYTSSLFTNL
jgi:ubiquinol oxidase